MFENTDANVPPCGDGAANASTDYLARATAACEAGDARLGLHLYLAAFEQASEADSPSEDAIFGLKQAWRVACSTGERSLAEYIFERLEPYLSTDELAACTEQLQGLALDRLEQFGISRDDLEEMSEALSQEALGMIMAPPLPGAPFIAAVASVPGDAPDSSGPGADGHGGKVPGPDGPAGTPAGAVIPGMVGPGVVPGGAVAGPAAAPEGAQPVDIFTYNSVPGFAAAVERMRALGIGLAGDPEFDAFVAMLNSRHGLEGMPVADNLLFCSPAREDASRFMMATVGELGLPAVRMRMEESFQGVPMLCVTAQAADADGLGALRRGFEGGGVLVLEDIDLWGSPLAETADDMAGFLMAAMSRGAREAVNLIRQAVENPDVYVLASAHSPEVIDPFFLDLLYPFTPVEIDYPTEAERADIWMDLARAHPSIRAVSRDELVRLSANMPRYDIYMAAREALEDAYKQGLVARRYQPVTRDNLFDKLAAYQPLESSEYAELENAVIADFSASLGDLEDLL